MRNDCNIARDLMPLCIDGVASEESQRMVEAHVKACDECARLFEEMHDELPEMIDKQELARMDAAARKVNRRRMRRWLVAGFMVMLMSALISFVVVNYDELAFRARYVNWNGDLRYNAVRMEVFQQSNGCWSVMCSSAESGFPFFDTDMNLCYTEDGKGAYLQFRLIYDGMESEDGDCAWLGTWGNVYDEVWSIPNYESEAQENVPVLWVEMLSGYESRVIWRQGDETLTHKEINEYLALYNK